MAPLQGEVGQSAFYRQIAQMDRKYTDEVENRYGFLDCPATLLWGEKDEWIPLERGHKLAGRLTGGESRSFLVQVIWFRGMRPRPSSRPCSRICPVAPNATYHCSLGAFYLEPTQRIHRVSVLIKLNLFTACTTKFKSIQIQSNLKRLRNSFRTY